MRSHQARLDRIVSWLCSASATDLERDRLSIVKAIDEMVFLMMACSAFWLRPGGGADIDHESDEVI